MEIILKQDVDNLGHKNDIVNVRPGYANNYLIPNGLATLATPSAKKVAAENVRQTAHKEAKFRADAAAVAEQLAAITLVYKVKTKGGKIAGTITSTQIADDLAAKGFTFDKKNIAVAKISTLGEHEASIKLYKEVKGIVKIQIEDEREKEEVAVEEVPAAE